jgi:hypothetical protein
MSRTTCHCSHDIDTHHQQNGTCLAAYCKCKRFRDASKTDPDGATFVTSMPKNSAPTRPHDQCTCQLCLDFLVRGYNCASDAEQALEANFLDALEAMSRFY